MEGDYGGFIVILSLIRFTVILKHPRYRQSYIINNCSKLLNVYILTYW